MYSTSTTNNRTPPNEFHHAYTTITTANAAPTSTLPLHRALCTIHAPLSSTALLSLVVIAFPFTEIVRVLIFVLYTVSVIRSVTVGERVTVRVTYLVTVAPLLPTVLVLFHEFHHMMSCQKPFPCSAVDVSMWVY